MSLKIAVIDDGINEKIYNTKDLLDNIEVDTALNILERKDYNALLPSHGSTCAAIIGKYAPDAAIGSIKILEDDNKSAMTGQLLKAMEWCSENGYRIVNLSLGTTQYRDFESIEKAVTCALAKGLIIVASCNNKNIITFPASLPGVIGVKCDTTLTLRDGGYYYNEPAYDGIDITAHCCQSLVNYKGETAPVPRCNSFATPLITAMVYKILNQSPKASLSKIKALLKKHAEARPINNVRLEKTKIEIPMILITDYTANQQQRYEEGLVFQFRKNGYNAVLIEHGKEAADISQGYVTTDFRNTASFEHIKLINRIYDPDIIIVSVNMYKGSGKYLIDLLNFFEIDIRIIIAESYDKAKEYLMTGNADNYMILLPYEEISDKTTNDVRILNYSGCNFLEEIYNSIIKLFGN